MLNRKVTIILSTVRLIKKDTRLNDCIFSKPRHLGGNVKVELDLSNYTTKSDLKDKTSVTANVLKMWI